MLSCRGTSSGGHCCEKRFMPPCCVACPREIMGRNDRGKRGTEGTPELAANKGEEAAKEVDWV